MKTKPIDISTMPDEQLEYMYNSLDHSINHNPCEDCNPPPEAFQLFERVTDEMESRKLI